MKHVKKLIKLTNLNSEGLNEEEQNVVVGGTCYCSCYYAMCGGSSTEENNSANTGDMDTDEDDLISVTPGPGEWGYT